MVELCVRLQGAAFQFGCATVRVYAMLSRNPQVPLHLLRQLVSCGTSVGAALHDADALDDDGAARLARVTRALTQARTAQYWLHLLAATDLVSPTCLSELLPDADALIALLVSARRQLLLTTGSSGPRVVGHGSRLTQIGLRRQP